MNLGQTIITLGAFMLMSRVILGVNTSFVVNGMSIDEAKAVITSLSVATSYIELAQGLPFDEETIDQFIFDTNVLTPKILLGPDAGETNSTAFDDFDDFAGWETLVIIGGREGVPDSLKGGDQFKLQFDVYYVNSADINTVSNSRTFLKRMDLKVWRAFPEGGDTLSISYVLGYWNFI